MTFSKLVASIAALGVAAAVDLPEHVVDCGKYAELGDQRACLKSPAPGGADVHCVGAGWFSKVNTVEPNRRIDATQVCRDQGYTGVDAEEYGGNWGRQCNYPGVVGEPTKVGGPLDDMGFTVVWKCAGVLDPTPAPTPVPTPLPTPAPTLAPTPAPTLLAQPEGPELTILLFQACDKNSEPMEVPIVWAPGKCQRDPISEDESIILTCKDGGVHVEVFAAADCDHGKGADAPFVLKHDQCANLGGEENDEEDSKVLAVIPDVIREECKDPTFNPVVVPKPLPPVDCVSVGDPHFRFFDNVRADFQARGEFNLWKTEGLTVQVRHGPNLLAPHVNTVSTNNAIAIGGSQVCGHVFEIYAEDGGWMRVWPAGAETASEYFGITNVIAAIQEFDCPAVRAAGVTMGFRFDNSVMNVHVVGYGINICLHVEGQAYLDSDIGICTQRMGWERELNCEGTLFTHYKEGNCALLPRPEVILFDINDCDAGLRVEAEKVCSKCPKTIHPEDCVLEVCALGSVGAAADLLEACEITVQIAPPRDVHCTSLGDPHLQFFDTTRADFQDRGEFIMYETSGLSVFTRHGARPDIPEVAHISTNHGASIVGEWTCNAKYEFYHNLPSQPQVSKGRAIMIDATPMLKVTSAEGEVTVATGIEEIASMLTQRNRCQGAFIGISRRGPNMITEFALQDGAVRVRVQFAWWGLNVWVDVEGPLYLDSDIGICTKRDGAFEQVSCDDDNFTVYPTTCEDLDRGSVPPVDVIEDCSDSLKMQAREVCDACPKIVSVEDCVFEVCAIGEIAAAEQLITACDVGTPVVTVPTPAPAPKPDVQCVSSGDPHFRYFDRSGGDFQSRGHFTLYKTETWEVQVRQGVHLTLSPTHAAYPIVSTNNAFVVAGELFCGNKIEVDAATQSMKISAEDGPARTFTGAADILASFAKINLDCPTVSVNGNVVSFGDGTDFQMRWQLATWGINIWIDVRGAFYLDTDSGICTKRAGWTEPLDCEDVLFTEFPNGNTCEQDKKENDKVIDPVAIEDTKCDAELKRKAEEICGRCPDAVAPRDCVLETCLLGTIDAAEELLQACDLAPPPTCGEPGKVMRRDATKVKALKKELNGKKAPSSCACRDACAAAGGTEWTWKPKRGRCKCYEGAAVVAFNGSSVKGIAGTLEGSSAEITRKEGSRKA